MLPMTSDDSGDSQSTFTLTMTQQRKSREKNKTEVILFWTEHHTQIHTNIKTEEKNYFLKQKFAKLFSVLLCIFYILLPKLEILL